MSVIIASGEAISKSPLNHSPSKQLFSFGKAPRFVDYKNNGNSNNFYNLPEVRMKRATSFGMGNKYDFTSGAKGNNAQFLNDKSDFDQDHPYSPRYSFGLGREKYAKVYYETSKMLDKDIPGPGKYDILKPFGHDSFKYSMKGKHQLSKSMSAANLPGPGSYSNCLQISEKGKFPLSKIANISEVNFGISKSQRFVYDFGKNPGPADYTQKPLMGSIFNSRYRSSQGKSIYAKYKDIDSRSNNPGPGEYRAFSEFGIYEAKNANKSTIQEEPN